MKIYRRIIILIALLIITYLIDYTVKNEIETGNKELVEAFTFTDFEINEATIKCWGKYQPKYLNKDEMIKVVQKVANTLNLSDYQEEWKEEDDQKSFTIYKEANHAQTTIQLIENYQETEQNTFHVNNYIIVEIQLTNQCGSITHYEKLVNKCFEELGSNANTNISVIGSKSGKIPEQEAYHLMETMLQSLGGKVTSKEQISDVYTLMGYSERFPRYLKIDGKKVNIDMAVTYHEEEQKTFLNMAIPVITTDY